jgi:YbbR domain-containing protein
VTRTLRRILGAIVQNFWWKVLALAIATLIWGVVANEPALSTTAAARLEYRNLPEDLEISSELPETVRLELQGPSSALSDLGENRGARPAVVLDMSNALPGERTFAIGRDNVKVARGIRLVRAIPSQVRVQFDRSADPRSVPVSVRFEGEGRNGYVLAHYDVLPRSLRIVGPEGHVRRVTAAATDPVDLSTVVGSSEFRVNAYIADSYIRFLDPPSITVTVTMKRKP